MINRQAPFVQFILVYHFNISCSKYKICVQLVLQEAELLVEAREDGVVVGLTVLDPVELLLQAPGVVNRQDVVEALDQQIDHQPAQPRRPEPPFDLLGIVARLQDTDDRRVGARAADAVLLELLDQCRFAEAGRRLGELLLRVTRISGLIERVKF